MSSTKLIAIDFGSTRISAMAAEVLDSGAVRVLSEESKASDDVKWGIVDKPSGASFKVSEILKLLKNSAKMQDISLVSVAIGAKSMKMMPVAVSRFVPSPGIVTEGLLADMMKECERKVRQPDITVFDVTPAEYMVDGVVMDDPAGKEAMQITATFNVIAGSKIIRSELERCFDRTGIMLETSPLTIDAISTVVVEEHEKEIGCALINLGATTTTLAVYHDGIVQRMQVIPLGAKNITKDIQELGINEANAERLKCIKGSALEAMVLEPMYIQIAAADDSMDPVKISTKFLATIIEARLDEILLPIFEIFRSLPFDLEAGIVLSGGGSKLNNIVDYIEQKSGIYTRIGSHVDWLSDDTHERFHDPLYSQLIGTILLNNEYRNENPIETTVKEPQKKPKLPGRKLGSRITEGFFNFFNEDNKMNS